LYKSVENVQLSPLVFPVVATHVGRDSMRRGWAW
jgi:hypothetical protein